MEGNRGSSPGQQPQQRTHDGCIDCLLLPDHGFPAHPLTEAYWHLKEPMDEFTLRKVDAYHNGDRLKALWKLKDDDDSSESTIEAVRNWKPRVTCRALCKCYPARAVQVYELEILRCAGVVDGGRGRASFISGFFAIRDYYDRRRIRIFNTEETGFGAGGRRSSSIVNFTDGAAKLDLIRSHRGILDGDLVLEYRLTVKGDHNDKDQPIAGAVLYKQENHSNDDVSSSYSSSRIIHARIPINNNPSAEKMMILKFVRFDRGIEAQITVTPSMTTDSPREIIKPSTSSSSDDHLCCFTARMGDIVDEIELFSGKYGQDSQPMEFVLVVPFSDILELKLCSSHTATPQKFAFDSFYHGHNILRNINIGRGMQIDMEIKWSRM